MPFPFLFYISFHGFIILFVFFLLEYALLIPFVFFFPNLPISSLALHILAFLLFFFALRATSTLLYIFLHPPYLSSSSPFSFFIPPAMAPILISCIIALRLFSRSSFIPYIPINVTKFIYAFLFVIFAYILFTNAAFCQKKTPSSPSREDKCPHDTITIPFDEMEKVLEKLKASSLKNVSNDWKFFFQLAHDNRNNLGSISERATLFAQYRLAAELAGNSGFIYQLDIIDRELEDIGVSSKDRWILLERARKYCLNWRFYTSEESEATVPCKPSLIKPTKLSLLELYILNSIAASKIPDFDVAKHNFERARSIIKRLRSPALEMSLRHTESLCNSIMEQNKSDAGFLKTTFRYPPIDIMLWSSGTQIAATNRGNNRLRDLILGRSRKRNIYRLWPRSFSGLFNLKLDHPDCKEMGVPPDSFVALVTGWINPPKAGKYAMKFHAFNGGYLFLNDCPICKSTGNEKTNEIWLYPRPYLLKIALWNISHSMLASLKLYRFDLSGKWIELAPNLLVDHQMARAVGKRWEQKERRNYAPEASIAASEDSTGISAANDGIVPDSSTQFVPVMAWRKRGGKAWIQYTFQKIRRFSSFEIYWYDEESKNPQNPARTPNRWWMQYFDESKNTWEEIRPKDSNNQGLKKGQFNKKEFFNIFVRARRLRLVVEQRDNFYCGVVEWRAMGPPSR